MSAPKLFIHGVPDTSHVWEPLIAALDLKDARRPPLPGFMAPLPKGFVATKEGYSEWLIKAIEAVHGARGPVDILGHDWGALLVLRAVSLRPELINSWAVSGAVIHPDYRGHQMAQRWATPIVGELIMMLTRKDALRKALIEAGLPEAIAVKEVATWERHKRRAILKLYRSANGLRFEGDWVDDLKSLPEQGLVIWGENDPYVDIRFGREFAQSHNAPFYVEEGAGHWAIAERAESVAARLNAFWAD